MNTLYFRAPGARTQHILQNTNTSRTLCGRDAGLGARYAPADLPSGERLTKTCRNCTVVARGGR